MPGAAVVSLRTADAIRELLRRGPSPEPRRPRGVETGRAPLLVKCTSATAASGSGVGAQCYPAVVLDPDSSVVVASQPTLGEVWLTVIDSSGSVVVPTSGGWYHGLMAGTFDDDGDERPRVFAATRASSGISGIDVEDTDENPTVATVTQLRFESTDGFTVSSPGAGIARVDLALSTSESTLASVYDISADDTWENTGLSVSLPNAGTYLLYGHVTSSGTVSAIQAAGDLIYLRLFNSTNSTQLWTEYGVHVRTVSTVAYLEVTPILCVVTVDGAKTVRLEGYRNVAGSATVWTLARIASGSRLGYVRIG
jgi:hypothetical protein